MSDVTDLVRDEVVDVATLRRINKDEMPVGPALGHDEDRATAATDGSIELDHDRLAGSALDILEQFLCCRQEPRRLPRFSFLQTCGDDRPCRRYIVDVL